MAIRLSQAFARVLFPRSAKYHNVPTMQDGVRFDSRKEARRHQELQLEQRAGGITDLQRQVRFPIVVNGLLITTFVANHVYQRNGLRVVEDTKGVRTREYRLKAKLMRACYGIEILET